MTKINEKFELCKDNLICCDDNCQRCANLIYKERNRIKAEKSNLEKIQKRNKELIINLILSIDNNLKSVDFENKIKIIKESGITPEELKELGFEHIICYMEDSNG